MLTKSNRTEIQTYNVEERTFGPPCIFPFYNIISNSDYISLLQRWHKVPSQNCPLTQSAISVTAWFYSKDSSFSAQTFSISSQVSSDKSVEYIEKENLKDISITENYCYSLKIKQSSTQRQLLATVAKTCANNLQQNWHT